MPAFSFEALDAQGQTRKGLLEADTAKSARSMLRAQALVPLTVELVQTGQTAAGGSTSLGQRLFTRPVFSATTLAQETGADELILVCDVYDPALRLRSLDIAAQAHSAMGQATASAL